MASPVDTSVKHALSTMANAMVVNGTAGSGIALMDAFLVTGWDVKSATTLVVAGGVATLSFSLTHSATVDSVILVSGVTGALTALNGEQKITAVGSGFVRFATAAADGTAAGTISFKMAPAGWTKVYSGTNLAVYKSSNVASTGMHLRVDDTGTYQMRVVGYESMTDVNTGTGPFPTVAMISGGGLWAKSFNANSTAVPWMMVADDRMFYLNVAANYSSNTTYVGQIARGFGDLLVRRPGGDPYACTLNCHNDTTTVPATNAMRSSFASGSNSGGCYLPRDYTGLGSAVALTAYPYIGSVSPLSGTDTRFSPFPTVFGDLMLSSKYVATAGTAVAPRAALPGVYHLPHTATWDTFKTGDTVVGTGALVGRKLMMVAVAESASANVSSSIGNLAFDITGPWR